MISILVKQCIQIFFSIKCEVNVKAWISA